MFIIKYLTFQFADSPADNLIQVSMTECFVTLAEFSPEKNFNSHFQRINMNIFG